MVALVADNLKRQWFWVVYFGIRDWLHKATWEDAGPDYLTWITTIILQILTTKHLWGNHLLPSGHENLCDDTVVVTLWMFPGLSVRKSGPAAWQVSYAISLWYQSKPRVTTVWLKWTISFYSGKDLCTEGEVHLLLYSTRAALPTLPIDGCHKD